MFSMHTRSDRDSDTALDPTGLSGRIAGAPTITYLDYQMGTHQTLFVIQD